MKPRVKVLRWFLFIVVVALLPFVLHALFERRDNHDLTIGTIFGRGELLIAAIAIAMDGGSELIASKTRRNLEGYAVICSFVCFAMVILATGVYGYNAAQANSNAKATVVTPTLIATPIATPTLTEGITSPAPSKEVGVNEYDAKQEIAIQSLVIFGSAAFAGLWCKLLVKEPPPTPNM